MEGHNVFSVPNATTPYCDILIIGAGLSGVATAYHLLDDNPSPPSIVILETRQVCPGATGRNGGHLMRVHAHIEKVTKEAGPEAAKELSQFQASQVHAMKRVAEKEKLDCDALLTWYLETSVSQPQADEQRKVYENQVENNLDFIGDINYIQPKYVEEISGVKGAKGGLTATALQLWPYKFVTCLLARLIERSSINAQTHTRVTSISQCKDGFSIASTPRGSIRAKKVVYATNGYTSGHLPEFAKKIVPVKVTCSHISTPKGSANPPPHLNHTYGLSYEPLGTRDYLIPRPDGTVICGGARNTTLIEPARAHFETIMQKNFIGWEDSGAHVDYLWTGTDGWPHCGQVPSREKHYILAGYNVAGMPLIFLTAKGIAKMIRDDVPFESTSIPKIFKTTEEHLKKDVTS
ncbi:related to oxidoreductase [Phialocephala subalpina]|uniref:Related to oxidoreductase n=1 Tax=Phialocephala subalpina TaxID=576137 RepID=A0A1L7X255_9HELO|nr:related to oxidoreductase [Phialocephala subalpina]